MKNEKMKYPTIRGGKGGGGRCTSIHLWCRNIQIAYHLSEITNTFFIVASSNWVEFQRYEEIFIVRIGKWIWAVDQVTKIAKKAMKN